MARQVASARDIDESPRYAAGTLMTRNAPARTCIMTATQKYRTSPLPAAIPGGFARGPASSRVATVRFAHPLAAVAAAFHGPRNHDPNPARAAATGFQSYLPGSANPTTPNLRQPLAADHGQPATSLQHARPPAPRTSQLPNRRYLYVDG